MIVKLRTWINAINVARLYVKNWPYLLLLSLLGRKGRFRARGGGETLNVSAKLLLKHLVRLNEHMYNVGIKRYDRIRTITFNGLFIELRVLGGFGLIRFKINQIWTIGAIPEYYFRIYDVNVSGKVVLDIGAYVGDSVLLWLYKGAKRVIAVEPVPEHLEVLVESTKGLPVTIINAAIGESIPKLPTAIGSGGYGLKRTVKDVEQLNVPLLSLKDLVLEFKPEVVKLNCEGCEHAVLNQIVELPSLGVDTLIIQFHDRDYDNKRKEDAYNYVAEKLRNKGRITLQSNRLMTVIWEMLL